MTAPRLAYGSLHHHGANLLPDDLEGVDYLLLDGGPPLAPNESLNWIQSELRQAIRRLAPQLYLDPQLTVVATLAGAPEAKAAWRVADILNDAGSSDLSIGVVFGSRVLDRLEELLAAGERLRYDTTGEPFTRVNLPPRLACLSLDAEPILAAVGQRSRIVLISHADLETVQLQMRGEVRSRGQTTPMTIKLETGASSRLLIRNLFAGPNNALQPLADAWIEALREAGMPTDGASVTSASETGVSNENLMLAQYRGAGGVEASQAVRLLRQLVATRNPQGAEFVEVIGPEVKQEFQTWPTSIPTDLVEWSVDVRPAKDWVE